MPNNLSNTFTSIYDGSCHHLAVTRLGSTLTFYIDGIAQGTGSSTKSINSISPNSLYLGYDTVDNASNIGTINEARFWNKGLSAAEITNNYNVDIGYSTANLIGYWKLDEPSGQAVIDLSSVANNGYLGTNSTEFDTNDPIRTTGFCYSVDKIGDHIIENFMIDSTKSTSSSVMIYPNPFSEEINVLVLDNLNQKGELSILDINGRVMGEESFFTNEVKKVSYPFSAGVYILQIKRNDNVETYKIIKTE